MTDKEILDNWNESDMLIRWPPEFLKIVGKHSTHWNYSKDETLLKIDRWLDDNYTPRGESITVQDVLDLNMTGNEFSMGYDDSACVWNFYWGERGQGRMLFGHPKFWYEGELTDALAALKKHLETTN